jgi:hypothetical protein
MGTQKRKFERHELEKIAHIEILEPCIVADISKMGARLMVADPQSLPEKFVIALKGDLRRWCQVRWRKTDQVGVEFISDPMGRNTVKAG